MSKFYVNEPPDIKGIWIEDLISTFAFNKNHYAFYEYLSTESIFFEERRSQMIPKEYEERRKATMLEF